MIVLAYLAAAVAIGFSVGYYIGWVLDEAERFLEAYLDGSSIAYWPELWR